ncbi:hypothetical protein SVAN01_08316 [Stagonosporopsis vannaccii]|nr:hypothetical protein SVAN01_08316 [Stagonosporopsis vannaccii]
MPTLFRMGCGGIGWRGFSVYAGGASPRTTSHASLTLTVTLVDCDSPHRFHDVPRANLGAEDSDEKAEINNSTLWALVKTKENGGLSNAETKNSVPTDVLNHLRSAQWFAFGLDDTLYSFRQASSAAIKTVLAIVHGKTTVPIDALEKEYKITLTHGMASAFIEGKTSHQYRDEQFQRLVQNGEIDLADGEVLELVDLY